MFLLESYHQTLKETEALFDHALFKVEITPVEIEVKFQGGTIFYGR